MQQATTFLEITNRNIKRSVNCQYRKYTVEHEFYDQPKCHVKVVENDRWLFKQV